MGVKHGSGLDPHGVIAHGCAGGAAGGLIDMRAGGGTQFQAVREINSQGQVIGDTGPFLRYLG